MEHALDNGDEVPIVYIAKYKEFAIKVLDGGSSYIVLKFCPWCGHILPRSQRKKL